MPHKAQEHRTQHTSERPPLRPGSHDSTLSTRSGYRAHPVTVIQRALAAPRSLTADDVQYLQRTVGNQRTCQLLARGRDLERLPRREADSAQLSTEHGAEAERRTAMPASLRAGLEQRSGFDLGAVRVHYNSSEPSRLNAFAYTQGTDIVLGPGQEQYLPHEGWHVVQQMQGRVKPTMRAKGLSISDDEGLEREADVMGRRALDMGERSGPFASRPVTATMEASHAHVIQRATSFVPGKVTEVNLAERMGAALKTTVGETLSVLNGTMLWDIASVRRAINAPTLVWQSIGTGVEVQVAAAPTNVASFTMEVPSKGPWSTVTTKKSVKLLFEILRGTAPAACDAGGDTTFTVHGKPSDAAFAADTRTHEDLHARDNELGFLGLITPWDVNLQRAQAAGTQFSGPTEADAEAALYSAMDGTPDEMADRLFNLWRVLSELTHWIGKMVGTASTGGPYTSSNHKADATCTTSSLDVT